MSAATRDAAVAAYPPLRLYIDGGWIGAADRATADVVDPTSESVLGRLPLADEADLARAIAAAERAFARWRAVPAIERGRLLRAVADRLRSMRDRWAALIALELGKPLVEALRETDTACEMFEWAAEEARRLYGRTIPSRTPGLRLTTVPGPIGPVGGIAGWNAPAITPARKISGALGAGCTIVMKPSEATPATALMIAEACDQAGVPAGVVNMLFGDPPAIGHRFATDPAIRLVTFTGGTGIGKQLAALGAGSLKRMVLELGGHAPAIVCDDVDAVAVATAAVAAKFRNVGQVCTSPTRFLVQAGAYEAFAARFIAEAAALQPGDPFDPATKMGPMQNRRRTDAIAAFAADARDRGARVAIGPGRDGPGFWHPTVVATDLPAGARAYHEEPFGPLAIIQPFATIDDALGEANRLPMGLASYAFTHDLRTAERLAAGIEAGTLSINHWVASFPETPFGGVKDSGVGSEGGSEGLAAFQQLRFVSVMG